LGMARTLSRLAVWIGGAMLIAISLLIGAEAVSRKLLGMSIHNVDEISGYALAISSSWAMAFALLDRTHIRIDGLYGLLPVRAAAVLDILCLVGLAGFLSVLLWHAGVVLQLTLAFGSRSNTTLSMPLW